MKRFTSVALLVWLGSGAAHPPVARAAIPPMMNYQGYIENGGGPVNGTLPMTFSLFATPTGGAPLWSESYAGLTIAGGVFHVLLGSIDPLPLGSLFTGQTLWIETVVNGNTLLPRRPIVSVPYAARAAVADSAATVASAAGGAVTYTRWGRTSCPPGASTVYTGRIGGANYQQSGGGKEPLCLTDTPSWDDFNPSSQNASLIYGTEYETSGTGLASLAALQDFDAPCIVCLRENARISLMIPGTQICPAGWNLEYAGYLMGSHYTQTPSVLICIDRNAEGVPGTGANFNGYLLYPVEAECGSLPCGPYVQDRELTCVVCSRP